MSVRDLIYWLVPRLRPRFNSRLAALETALAEELAEDDESETKSGRVPMTRGARDRPPVRYCESCGTHILGVEGECHRCTEREARRKNEPSWPSKPTGKD